MVNYGIAALACSGVGKYMLHLYDNSLSSLSMHEIWSNGVHLDILSIIHAHKLFIDI